MSHFRANVSKAESPFIKSPLNSMAISCYCLVLVKVKVKSLSRVWFFGASWTVACQAPLSMGFSQQGSLSGLPFPSPGDLPHPGIEHRSAALPADSSPSEPPGKPKSSPALLWPHVLMSPRLLHPWDSPGKNTRVGSLPFQGIFLNQGSNLHLRLGRWTLNH